MVLFQGWYIVVIVSSEIMKPCHLVEIVTPKKYILNGLLFGPVHPMRVIIFVHGLASSAFQTSLAYLWSDKHTAVLTFSNRGHDKISKLYRSARTKKGYSSAWAGEAHEIFVDCVDDIQGAIDFVYSSGATEIYLAGHSTGCQKSVYYVSKRKTDILRGLILIAPLSDYAVITTVVTPAQLARATAVARGLVKAGGSHQLMPKHIWNDTIDAQRFLSLYAPDSPEEIFTYARSQRRPAALEKVRLPILVILAEEDEYRDQSMEEVAGWFNSHIVAEKSVCIIEHALHGFHGTERAVAQKVKAWLREKRYMHRIND